MPNGDIKPCMFMKSLGNIKNEKFERVYIYSENGIKFERN